jgi:hypothetical protein
MDDAGSKSRTRKLMRVATTFTGVAACTAGMVQAVNAQDVAQAAPKHIGRTARPAGRLAGSIRSAVACGYEGTDKTWLHVSTTNEWSSGYEYTSVCFGYKGEFSSPPFTGIRAECGGNNKGTLFGTVDDGYSTSIGFGPGTTYRTIGWSHFDLVTINGWTGTDTCPQAPDFGGGKAGY